MNLSTAFNNNITNINKCRTYPQVLSTVNYIINHNPLDDTNNIIKIRKELSNTKDYVKAMEIVFDYMMEDRKYNGREIERNSWFVGNPIHGMECSNSYR